MRCFRGKDDKNLSLCACKFQNANGPCSFSHSIISLNSCVANDRYAANSLAIDKFVSSCMPRHCRLLTDEIKSCNKFDRGCCRVVVIKSLLTESEVVDDLICSLYKGLISRSIDVRSERSNVPKPSGS